MHKKTIFFLTTDTTLPASDLLRFRKNLYQSYKNYGSWSNENFGQQNYEKWSTVWKAAKISALSSNNFAKYECLNGECLGFKPSTVEQARFDYSPLNKIFK